MADVAVLQHTPPLVGLLFELHVADLATSMHTHHEKMTEENILG